MASTTALTMVNRLLRRHGFEDYTTFVSPETLLGLDLVNQAINDLTSQHDYPWNIHSDGALVLRAEVTGTSGATIAAGSSTLTITGATGVSADYTGYTSVGTVVAKVLLTDAATHDTTAMQIRNLQITAGTMTAELIDGFPEAVSNSAYKIFFAEYLLPDDIKKVISVRHEGQPLQLLNVSPHQAFDEVFPRPHDYESGDPTVVAVGGSARSTYVTSGGTYNERLRMMVWPIPTTRTLLWFSYKRRMDPLTATTSTLVAPVEFVDDVIDRAEALSNMTQRFNAPELAQLQIRNTERSAERKFLNSTLDPARRTPLRPQDNGRRRDFTRYRDIDGL